MYTIFKDLDVLPGKAMGKTVPPAGTHRKPEFKNIKTPNIIYIYI